MTTKNGDEHVTDIEAAERVLAQLSDQKDRASEQVSKTAARRQVLAYTVLAHADKKAQDELTTLNQQLADLAVTVGDIDGAVAEARRRLAATQQAANRADAQVHIDRINELLTAVQELAPKLDVCWGSIVKGSAGGFRHEVGPKDPPLLDKVGNLVVEITGELKALKLDRAVWLPGNFALMHVDDFRIQLEKLAQAYQHGPPVRAHNFVELISSWSASVKSRHEAARANK